MSIIEKGYRITVESWENDGDYCKTESITVKTKREAQMIVDLAKLHKSQNNHKDPGFGNMYEPDESRLNEYHRAIAAVLRNYIDILDKELVEMVVDPDHEDSDAAADWISDLYLYNLGLVGGNFYTRVLDGFIVEYIPEDIVLKVVTVEFE